MRPDLFGRLTEQSHAPFDPVVGGQLGTEQYGQYVVG